MRIISLNTWGGACFDGLMAWLPTAGGDVLCLQEVTRTPGLTGWTRFTDEERALPQRANLFEDVRGVLPSHQGIFHANDAGPVLDDGGVVHRQDFGLAVLVAEHLRLVDHRSTFVHGTFVEHAAAWPSSGRPRRAQGVRVLDREGGRVVTVIHLHGLRDRVGKGDTPARLAQAARLARLVTELRGRDDLVVVCGDLNVLPDSQTFDVLGELGLVDLVGEADTRTSLYPKPVRHADYLLVSDPTEVKGFEVLAAPEVSDHRPLVLDV